MVERFGQAEQKITSWSLPKVASERSSLLLRKGGFLCNVQGRFSLSMRYDGKRRRLGVGEAILASPQRRRNIR